MHKLKNVMLTIVHCCKKFNCDIVGKKTAIESHYKPLQAIFAKPLLSALMSLQVMMLKLQPYDMAVKYVSGKDIPIGDALSHANLP